MSDSPEPITSDNALETPPENARQIKIGNTTIEIIRHFSGTCTYEDIVCKAIKRLAENG